MAREKQIEEMAAVINEMDGRNAHYYDEYMIECEAFADADAIAKVLYDAGYRKQSEGEWEKFEGERFICSNCAKVFGLGSTATIYDVKRVWKYCPNCGAKMKGGEE